MDKRLKIGILILLILILISVGVFCIARKNKGTTDKQEDTVENSLEEDTTDEEEEIEHNLKMTIISPEEDIIIPKQARMYEALVEGNGKYANQVRCNWKFYLNENNEEVLYKEQDNTGILSGESKELCGFTSTFIDKVGKLRVVLTLTVFNAVDDNLETITAEREYLVQK